ncbi:enoyl-[acyl-carrier-protein] reductase [NADH] [Pseudonocardia sediminis]|uniref:Enoyl-[acyl-carrier-protein] reductase [NADH] n=1 Tax=Pseudonocardia sediminis TaxID=1397368 RepID=A0A4Q7V7B7_PSEST|nr:enoyl-ACP reductase FabI [Pseudonocardia sediminis]RZT88639.1 enoyl-[acyl-carrier-protein] reductase [NADH] [Pseudonocardia sediminis]
MTDEQGLLAGRTLLVTGVITESSIAFHVARLAQEQGATVILTGYGRMSLVERIARRLPTPVPVVELDVTDAGHRETLAARVGEHTDHLDGVLHSVAFAPAGALGGRFLDTTWDDAATALHVSAYSLQSVVTALRPLLGSGASVVGLDFDASRTFADYDWMGVAKAALESCSRYLARYLGPAGIRVNLVAAGPLATMAARNIAAGGEDGVGAEWDRRAPLGWDTADASPVARACVVLLSGWLDATTGEIVHVDGGAHAVGDRGDGGAA